MQTVTCKYSRKHCSRGVNGPGLRPVLAERGGTPEGSPPPLVVGPGRWRVLGFVPTLWAIAVATYGGV